mmetsp:Transcript_44931/g.66099  ORF Transcript_44931/g.66099 Transcript_44931/m.66099 type:complete len:348 (+) Transcript_44931:112-1155(+)|eukprot:CAMPEP_0195522620 /NCGR_PEP_ID=MMETSP0794_2-20130614/20957_1 /TAXON_ID=515487 /ORGANISM="Stephanopyxis turris, Strain CCMP 815" /LENGTH=347 /DNA_ID=CAMNT_0040652419 /DNA_START=58 /DNA_END=1101 /DNA_ORIENTATION=-
MIQSSRVGNHLLLISRIRRSASTLTPISSKFDVYDKKTEVIQGSSFPLSSSSLSNQISPSPSFYREQRRNFAVKGKEAYDRQQKRLASLPFRRVGKPRDVKKNAFRAWFDPVRREQEYHVRNARREKLDWKIRVMAVVERLPEVTPDVPEWEKEYLDLKEYLDSFGKVYPPESGLMPPEEDDGPVTEEELLALLPEGLVPAPRVTEADKNGDVKTLNRRLPTRVFFIVRQNEKWTYPSVLVNEDETLLSAVKRAVSESAGNELELYCPSNCPMAVNMIAYSDEEKASSENEGFYGEQMFFFRVQRDEGDVGPDSNVDDYAWLARDEMVARVQEEQGEQAAKFHHYLL